MLHAKNQQSNFPEKDTSITYYLGLPDEPVWIWMTQMFHDLGYSRSYFLWIWVTSVYNLMQNKQISSVIH